MSILRAKEIRALPKAERDKQLQQLRNEYSKERAAVASGTRPENAGKISEIRHTIARMHTIAREEALGLKKPKGQARTEKPKAKPEAKPAEKKPTQTDADKKSTTQPVPQHIKSESKAVASAAVKPKTGK